MLRSVARYTRQESEAFAQAFQDGRIHEIVEVASFVEVQLDDDDNEVYGLEAGRLFLKRWLCARFGDIFYAPAIRAMLARIFVGSRVVRCLVNSK